MIEVNEYVRTKNGYIIRVDENTNIFNLGWKEQYIDMETTRYGFTCEEEIVKHSKQLIDLIEVGDIVRIRTGLYSSFMEFIDNEECLLILKEQVKKFWAIEEILTKEQFEANCYKVGGEE